ncbi:glycosyltransferase family 1 protein [Geobacillus sp. BMUD]|uniref:glycosyltransferase family 4 protein n=1 Tax=Geobacillus TaxID=129337 RepID=UPI0014920E47|nr:glycosyltransferase family 1 protein [Geobacillus sp. BMUD]NNU83860.1 glycosyltransferase family 1 protein [Geobacillus sp. BMUD]
MKIAIDGRKLIGNRTGIGNYLLGILEELFRIDQKNKYYIFVDQKPEIRFNNPNVKYIRISTLKNTIKNEKIYSFLWLNLFIVPRLLREKIDIFWGPNFVKPLVFPNKRTIVTIHDLAFIKNKENHSTIHAFYLKYYLKFFVDKKLNILTVSHYTKYDIMKEYKIPEDNINVTYCALNPNLNIKSIRKPSLKLPKEYCLFVGTLEKRKNLQLILKAISYSIKNNLSVIPLVVVGGKGNGSEQIRKLIKELNIEEYVYFTGYISQEELAYIYENARLFIFPSLYEGFGIPLLEAMRYGVPIITSKTTSLPEVAQDAAMFVDPFSPKELSYVINKLLLDDNLRSTLIEKGKDRLKFFSWRKSAEVFLNVIKKMEGEQK